MGDKMEVISITNAEEMADAIVKYQVPIEIFNDVKSRIGDHILSGGTMDDSYVKQQYRYVENFIRLYR